MRVEQASCFFILHFTSSLLVDELSARKMGTMIPVIEYGVGVNSATHGTPIIPFATLQNDPKGSLPSKFTICSATSSPSLHSSSNFFTLRGENDMFYFSVRRNTRDVGDNKTPLAVLFHPRGSNAGYMPLVFASQWTKGCTSVDSLQGSVY